jgi:hypothetical protein
LQRLFYYKDDVIWVDFTDDFTPNSDVDVLVEFDPNHVPSLFQLIKMETESSQVFQGRKVDLRTPAELSQYFRADVINNGMLLYENRRSDTPKSYT